MGQWWSSCSERTVTFLKRSCACIIIVVSEEQEGLDPKVKGMFQTSRLYQSSSALGKSFCPCQTTSESEVAKRSLAHVHCQSQCHLHLHTIISKKGVEMICPRLSQRSTNHRNELLNLYLDLSVASELKIKTWLNLKLEYVLPFTEPRMFLTYYF